MKENSSRAKLLLMQSTVGYTKGKEKFYNIASLDLDKVVPCLMKWETLRSVMMTILWLL